MLMVAPPGECMFFKVNNVALSVSYRLHLLLFRVFKLKLLFFSLVPTQCRIFLPGPQKSGCS